MEGFQSNDAKLDRQSEKWSIQDFVVFIAGT